MNSNDIIHMAREAGIDAHIKVGAAELERFFALVVAAAHKQAEAVPKWVPIIEWKWDNDQGTWLGLLAAAPQPKERSNAVCRSDGKCQYAIDHDAEKIGHCPTGKCVMPRQAETALQPKGGSDMKKLLPCPFCGGEAGIERTGTPRQSCIVACVNCGARHESGDEAQFSGASWNRRTQPAPVTSVEVPRLTEAQIESICRVGAVYAPDGMVKRHPIEYRRELEANARSAVRKAEAALIAKWSKT